MLELDRLKFDTTDADAIAQSASVGAYVRSSDGTLITHTAGTGNIRALDVNIINAIAVEIDGVYDGSGNPNPDNVGLIVHTRTASPADAQQTKRTTGAAASADAVVAADTHGIDVNSFLMAFNGTTWDRLRNYTNKDLMTADICNVGFACVDVTVDDIAGGTQLLAANLTGRKKLIIQNMGKYAIYVGATGVTSTTGVYVSPMSNLEIPAGAATAMDFYALCSIAGKSCVVKVFELA